MLRSLLEKDVALCSSALGKVEMYFHSVPMITYLKLGSFYDSCYPYMFAFLGFETVVAWSMILPYFERCILLCRWRWLFGCDHSLFRRSLLFASN